MRLIKIILFTLLAYNGYSQNIGIRQVRGLTTRLNNKLNISDTTNKFISNVISLDDSTVYFVKGDTLIPLRIRQKGVSLTTIGTSGAATLVNNVLNIPQYTSAATIDTTSLSNRINLKLNISDTANLRLRPIAGTNMTITGTYPNLTFNSTGGSGGSSQWTTVNTNDIYYNTGNVGIGSVNTPTSKLSVNYDNIGVLGGATANAQGISIENNTAATSTVQQYSPMLRFRGNGWKTAATAASQPVDWRVYANTVSGSTSPSTSLIFDASVNGGGYATGMSVSSSGQISSVGLSASGSISATTAVNTNGTMTITNNGGATTSHDGLLMFPANGATSGVPVQYSPRIRWQGNSWDGAANIFNAIYSEMRPISGVSPTRGNLVFSGYAGVSSGGAGTDRFGITTDGGIVIYPMTKAQRDAIVSPQQGRIVFVSDNGGYLSYYNAGWFKVTAVAD